MAGVDWVETWLSAPRWRSYQTACFQDSQLALEVYEWNLSLSHAVMHDIAHIEVGVRNIYDQTLRGYWEGEQHWLFDSTSPVNAELWRTRRGRQIDLNARNRASIREAMMHTRSKYPSAGQVIAELPFGFWRHLTDAAHEKTLWVPYLNRVFPKGTDRKTVERALTLVNTVRNRASHHEPLFTPQRSVELTEASAAIIHLADALLPSLGDYIRRTSTLSDVLEQDPRQSFR